MPDISDEARELTVAQTYWGNGARKDFRPMIEKVNEREEVEAEEAMTPVPKALSAPEPAPLQESSSLIEQPVSAVPVQPVLPPLPTPPMPTTTVQQVADEGNGKPNELNEDEATTSPTPTPAPAPSTPSGSSKMSPGKSTPPAPTQPPTSA